MAGGEVVATALAQRERKGNRARMEWYVIVRGGCVVEHRSLRCDPGAPYSVALAEVVERWPGVDIDRLTDGWLVMK